MEWLMISFDKLIQESISHHDRLCPRQVLGIRIGLAGATALGLGAGTRGPAHRQTPAGDR